MKTRKQFPPFVRLDIPVDLSRLQADYDRLIPISHQHGEFHDKPRHSFIPLTHIDPNGPIDQSSWVGTISNRAYKGVTPGVTRNRNPLENDRNHNRVFEWAKSSYAIELAGQLGDFCKIAYSTIKPGGFLPTHIDFDPSNAYKVNICVRTGPESESAVWNHEQQRVELFHLQEGEACFLNTGRAHAAFNWDQVERTFLLIAFRNQEVHRYACSS